MMKEETRGNNLTRIFYLFEEVSQESNLYPFAHRSDALPLSFRRLGCNVSILKLISRVYKFLVIMLNHLSILMFFFISVSNFHRTENATVHIELKMNQTLKVALSNWDSEMALTCEKKAQTINLCYYKNKNQQFSNYNMLPCTWKRLLNTVFALLSQDWPCWSSIAVLTTAIIMRDICMLSGVMYINISINFLKTYPKGRNIIQTWAVWKKKIEWNNNTTGEFQLDSTYRK